MSRKKKGRIGSSFERFLKDEGTYEETSALAIKRALATTGFSSIRCSRPRGRSGVR